jgi:hypothetical protein
MSSHRSHRLKPSRTLAEAHLASSERGARLLAAAGGDAEHADRIDRVLEDLAANSSAPRSSEVIQLPARPYDRELDPEPLPVLRSPASPVVVWAGVALLGLLAWALLAAVAFGLYSLVSLL